jgi:hypothetical protein
MSKGLKFGAPLGHKKESFIIKWGASMAQLANGFVVGLEV